MEEVLVTAQKRVERLEDVPIPISVIATQQLADTNQLKIQDYYATVPGFSVSPSPGAGTQMNLALRGISTGFGTNPTVGVMVDGVPYGSPTQFTGNAMPDLDPSDLARIEVLRGPQGTLYGASSMGGLINFVTQDPTTDSVSGRLQAGASTVHNGPNVGYNVRGSVNVPITETFAVRGSGFYHQDPGYIDNVVSHVKGVNEVQGWGGHVSAMWAPADLFTLKTSALFQDIKGYGSDDVNRSTLDYPLPISGDLQQAYLKALGGYDRKTQAYSVNLNFKVGLLDLTSVSGYNLNQFSNSLDFSYALGGLAQAATGDDSLSGAPLFTYGQTKKFSEELRATAPIGKWLDLLLGGFFTHEINAYNQSIGTQNPNTGTLGPYLGFTPPGAYPSTYTETAGFADLTFHVNDKFDIQIGGRESHIKEINPPGVSQGLLNVFLGQDYSVPYPGSRADANAFTYLLTPQYKFHPGLMAYARIASGYRAGGANESDVKPNGLCGQFQDIPCQYSPDKTINYEVGIKGNGFDRKLTFDVSVYYIDWKNIQILLLEPNTQGTYNSNGSRAKSEGVEISVEARPLTGLQVTTWVSYDDAALTKPFPPDSAGFGRAGDRLPYSSRFSGNLSLNQEFPITDKLFGFAGGAFSITGERLGSFIAPPFTADQRVHYPGFAKLDLRGGATYGQWTLNLYINNVADRRGVLGGGAGTYPPFAFTYLQPRTIGLSAARTF